MATTPLTGFPAEPQTEFARFNKAPLTGQLTRGELWNARPASVVIAAVTPVAGVSTITIAANNPGDQVGVSVAGGVVPITAGADAPASAALLGPALEAASFASAYVTSATPAAAVVTVTGVLGEELNLVEYSPDATTATVAPVTAAVVQQKLCFGMGVVRDTAPSINNNKVRKPSSLSDDFMGVLVYNPGSAIPAMMVAEANVTYDAGYLMPGMPYHAARENVEMLVEFIGADPAVGDEVFFIMEGDDAGLWSTTDGGASQVTRGDVVFSTTDPVGYAVDALPDLTVASDTSDDITATALRDAWNGSAQHAAVAVMTVDTSGAESYAILSFIDTAVHTVAAVSPATADIVGITNTATAVAANARPMSEFSWSQPTITAAADAPARAYLQLSNP